MNENEIIGTTRHAVGKAEQGIGNAVDSGSLERQGRVDEIAGAVQQAVGRATEAAKGLVADAPGAVARAAEQGREGFARADAAIGRRLGDNGIFYIWGGLALAAFGLFAYSRKAAKPSFRHNL